MSTGRNYKIVVNPVAGKGKTLKKLPELEYHLNRYGLDFEIIKSGAPMDAADIANWNAHHDSDVIVAFGGDGTINEVVNGMIHTESVLGVIPCGTGNDFARELGIPGNIPDALKILVAHSVENIDLGMLEGRYFANAVGFGFDAKVNEIAQKMKFFRGTAVYIASIVQSLIEYKSTDMEVHFDGKVRFGKVYLVAVGNGSTVAGGVQLMPGAKINDALFQICHIEDIKIGTILKHFPKLFNGKIGEVSQVTLEKSSYLRIETEASVPVHMDGEVLPAQGQSFAVEIQPATLQVISGGIKQE